MTLHFVVTLKLKTVIKKNDSQLRSGAGSYRTVTLFRLHLNLNVSPSSGAPAPSSGSNTLLQTLYCTLTRTYKKKTEKAV